MTDLVDQHLNYSADSVGKAQEAVEGGLDKSAAEGVVQSSFVDSREMQRDGGDPPRAVGQNRVFFVFPSASQFGNILRHVSLALHSDEVELLFTDKGFEVKQMDARHVVLACMNVPVEAMHSYRLSDTGDLRIRLPIGRWVERLRAAGNQTVAIEVKVKDESVVPRSYSVSLTLKNERIEMVSEESETYGFGEIDVPTTVSAKIFLNELMSALRAFSRWPYGAVTFAATAGSEHISLHVSNGNESLEMRLNAVRASLPENGAVESSYRYTDLIKLIAGTPSANAITISFGKDTPLIAEYVVPVPYSQGAVKLVYYLAPSHLE